MEKLPIKIEVNHIRSDFANFAFYVYYIRKWKTIVIICAILAFVIQLNVLLQLHFSFSTSILYLSGFFLLFLVAYGLLGLLSYRSWKRLPAANGQFLTRYDYEFSDEGLLLESETSRTFQKWEGVIEVDSNRRYIFIFMDTSQAYVVPKREFADLAEANSTLEFLMDKMLTLKRGTGSGTIR